MKFYLNLIVLLAAAKGIAMPTLYPEGMYLLNVQNNTNSNYISDSKTVMRFYVLPPRTSEAKVSSLNTVTANVGFCGEIAQLQKYNADTVGLLNSMKLKGESLQTELKVLNTQLLVANQDVAAYVSKNRMDEVVAIDIKVSQLEKRLDDLYDKYKSCDKDCAVVAQDIQDSQKLRMDLSTKRFEISASNATAMNEYERKKLNAENLQKSIDTLDANWRKSQSDLRELYLDFNMMFDAHAKREGGRVSISYNSNWNENIMRLKADNPGFHFEAMPTKNAAIQVTAYSKNNLVANGSVLAFDVGGMSANGNNGVLVLPSYPDSFSGNAVLNLLAVCPLLHPELFSVNVPNLISDMSYGLTVSYDYPATMKYEVVAHYNMHRMYEIVKSQGTRGGFFSSSSWSDEREQELFKDSFWVDWTIQDDRKLFTEAQKMAIATDLRHQIMTRLASRLVMGSASAAKMAVPGAIPSNGALVLSNSLRKACPANIYCVGASLVVDVLQAIFGSSETRQSLTQIADVDQSDRYTNSEVVMQPMLTTFK